VRLGHQPAGSLFAPVREWGHTDDELPQAPHGPALPPHEPAGASDAAAGTDDTSPAGASPAEAGPPEKSPADEKSPAETRPADVTPADARPDDTGPAEAAQAEAAQAETAQAGAGPGGDEPTPGSSGAAPGSPASSPGSAAGSAGLPPRVPARQGPPPKSVPGTGPGAVPAPRPGSVPAGRPGSVPATRPGAVPAPRQAAGPPARRPAAQPSWAAVLVTTFRLWTRRRMQKTGWRVLAGLLAAVIFFAAGALTVILINGTPASNSPGTSQGGGAAQGGTTDGGDGALAAVALARKQAANWVDEQVNPDQTIGCDPVMCTALQAAHIQANRLIMLGPSEPDPLGSEILLDTATLRAQFGARLESVYAPVSLAAFGSGAARVYVRFVVPNSAHMYLADLARDVVARKAAGAEMLRNHSIHASPLASHQLIAGQVDTRLLVTLVTLAHSHPVDIISFGTNQPGASPGVPLRSAEIAGAPGPGSTPAVSVQTLRSFLSAQQPPYRPSAIVAVKTASRRTVLRVEYPAPSLLGLLGPHG